MTKQPTHSTTEPVTEVQKLTDSSAAVASTATADTSALSYDS
ncbi:hypothetical protein ACX80D_12190 [Arthrobacter sp. Sr24]